MRPDRLEAASSLDSVHYFMLTGEQKKRAHFRMPALFSAESHLL